MPHLDRLPTAEDGVDGLLRLAKVFGAEETFLFLGYIRQGGRADQPTGQTRAILAQQLVDEEIRKSGESFDDARRVVAERLGFTETTRTNFYKLAAGTTRRNQPIVDA